VCVCVSDSMPRRVGGVGYLRIGIHSSDDYVCVYVYTCVYVCVYTCVCLCVCMCQILCHGVGGVEHHVLEHIAVMIMCACMYICVYIRVCVFLFICVCMCVRYYAMALEE